MAISLNTVNSEVVRAHKRIDSIGWELGLVFLTILLEQKYL